MVKVRGVLQSLVSPAAQIVRTLTVWVEAGLRPVKEKGLPDKPGRAESSHSAWYPK